MYESLQSLTAKPLADQTRAYMNKKREEILENAFRRGLSKDDQLDVSKAFRDDMYQGWSQGNLTSADAFYHYYSRFTEDRNYFEANVTRLRTPAKVIWGEKDIYIRKEMGIEFASKANLEITVLSGLGHYPHLQSPRQTIEEIRASFND